MCHVPQVERLDDPSLCGKPLAVQQFNSGGFVAVSYEARAAGIRCGDGVGAAGRSQIARLRDMGAVSVAEACRRCPGLVVKPMRTDRYRQVCGRLLACPVLKLPGLCWCAACLMVAVLVCGWLLAVPNAAGLMLPAVCWCVAWSRSGPWARLCHAGDEECMSLPVMVPGLRYCTSSTGGPDTKACAVQAAMVPWSMLALPSVTTADHCCPPPPAAGGQADAPAAEAVRPRWAG
jgi:hypothetical protein